MYTVLAFLTIGILSVFWGSHLQRWTIEAFFFGVVLMAILFFFEGVQSLHWKQQQEHKEPRP